MKQSNYKQNLLNEREFTYPETLTDAVEAISMNKHSNLTGGNYFLLYCCGRKIGF